MKKVLIGLLTLTSLSSFAHPKDDELMTMIDLGSKLKIQKDLNIPAHNKIILKNGIPFRFFSQVEGNVPACKLGVYQHGREIGRDVVVRAGETLKLVDRYSLPGRLESLEFKTSRNGSLTFSCWRSMSEGVGLGIPTIGQLKQALGETATIELNDPIEL